MVTKASNSVLNLVDPPIWNLIFEEGVFDKVVIGQHVPNVGYFIVITDTSLAAPLIDAPPAYRWWNALRERARQRLRAHPELAPGDRPEERGALCRGRLGRQYRGRARAQGDDPAL